MKPQADDPRRHDPPAPLARSPRSLACLVVLALAACRTPAADPGVETSLATLPNSWTVAVTGGRVVALDPDGVRRWVAVLPQQDRITTPIAAAADGTAYLRGRRALHALGADGKWRWRQEVPGLPAKLSRRDAPIYGPIAMTDSTVALITEALELTAFTRAGEIRWRRELPGDGLPVAPPRCAPSGQVIVATTAGVLAVSPDGRIDWQAEQRP